MMRGPMDPRIDDRSADGEPGLLPDAVRALATAGALTFDALAEQLGVDHASLAFDDLVDRLVDLDRVVVLRDEALGDKVGLLGGVTITRRATADEVAGGCLLLDGDLGPINELMSDSVPLARGGRAHVEVTLSDLGVPSAHLMGPPGWLDGLEEGMIVGLRVADGLVHVDVGAEPRGDDAPAKPFAEGATRAFDLRSYDDDPRVELADALW